MGQNRGLPCPFRIWDRSKIFKILSVTASAYGPNAGGPAISNPQYTGSPMYEIVMVVGDLRILIQASEEEGIAKQRHSTINKEEEKAEELQRERSVENDTK